MSWKLHDKNALFKKSKLKIYDISSQKLMHKRNYLQKLAEKENKWSNGAATFGQMNGKRLEREKGRRAVCISKPPDCK